VLRGVRGVSEEDGVNRRRLITAVATAVGLVGLAGCGSGAPKAAPPVSYQGKTLTVWLMAGDDPPVWVKTVTSQFEAAFPGATLQVKPQQWAGIQSKVTSSLANLTPPDVIEIGNTQTSYYASTGALLDLDQYRDQLGAAGWTKSMDASTIVSGKHYAVPWFAGNRVVMYNKKLWNAARLTPPQTMAEWESDLDKLQNTKGVDSALYLPGQNWYAFDGFLQDAGADILTQQNNVWVGDLHSPAALSAAALFKKLQGYGKAPKDQDEEHPVQATVFAKGNVASMIAMGYEEAGVVAANPAMQGNIGYFPIPGATADKPAKTFLGGSNLAIAATSAQHDLALGFLKIALNDTDEGLYAKSTGFLPNRASLYPALKGNAYAEAAQQAAANAGYTPLVRAWGNVENPPNPISTLFLTPILEGKDPMESALKADAKLTSRIALG
jgi:N,N'-diacetylchitobiose transport system substrate-binding protein